MREKQSIPEEELAKFKNAPQEEIDAAHDEANMMRAKLGVKPGERGEIRAVDGGFEFRPTKQEYDRAFEAIEQLKQAAQDEPTYKKVFMEVVRKVSRPMQEFLHALDSVALANTPSETKLWEEMHEERLHKLDDAEKRLRDMQKSGAEFGKKETR